MADQTKRKRKGLGVAPYCLPEPTMADPVTHDELQRELQRLRSAVTLLANCCGAHIISQADGKRLMALLAPPYERDLYAEERSR